jgi:hypothetical protein
MLISDSFPSNRKKTYTFSFLDGFGNPIAVTTQSIGYFLVSDDAQSLQDKGVISLHVIDNTTVSASGLTSGTQRIRGTFSNSGNPITADVMITTTDPTIVDAKFTPGTESNQG